MPTKPDLFKIKVDEMNYHFLRARVAMSRIFAELDFLFMVGRTIARDYVENFRK